MHSRLVRRPVPLIGLLAVLALVAGACGSSAASAAPTPSSVAASALPTPTASAAPGQPSIAATTAPTETPSSPPAATAEPASAAPSESASAAPTVPSIPSFAIPSFTSDKELEAELPDTYQGVTLKKFSFTGTTLVNATSQSGRQLLALLQSLGKTPADLSFALASDPTAKLRVTFGAYRIKGADAGSWAPTLYQGAQQQSPGTTVTDANLGGKAVKRVVNPKSTQITYTWARGDVLFIVATTTDALAGPAIAVMP